MHKVLVILIVVCSWRAMGQDSMRKARRHKKHKARISQRASTAPAATKARGADTTIHWKSPESWKSQKK